MAWPTARRKSARVRTPPTNTSATTMTTSAGSSSSTAACGAFVDAEQQQTQQTYKCRRVEHTTYAALRHELLAYMEAACEAYVCGQQQQQHEQQQHEQYIDNGSSHSHQRLRHNDNEEEEEQVEAAAVYAHPQHSNNNNSDNVHDSRRPRRRDGASHATALAYVCAALRDAYRVLHACWTFRGSPHDAFEPRHALCPLTEQLLLSYGRHTRTPDARYLVLCGGVEQLPWVACAMTAMRELLRRYERQQQQQQQLPYEAAPRVLAVLSSPQLARRVVVVERVVVLNCRSFGWLSGDGSEDYAASARLLRAIDRALTRRVAALCATTTTATTTTRAGSTPAPRHRRHDNDDDDDERSNGERADASQPARVLLLLGDAMVMDGGVPALDVAARGEVYVTHMAFGRGLACIVSQPPPSTSSTSLPSASSSTTTSPLCAVAGTHSAMPHVCDDDDENRDGGGSGSDGARAWHLPPPASPLPLHARRRGDGDGVVSCGERSGAGVAAQAVLLTLRGPLLVHVQFTAEYDAVAMATATASTTAMASCRLQQQQQQQQLGQHEVHTSSSFVLHDDNNDDSRRCCYGALSPALLDMAEWLLQMLQAPQPVLVVEWQLQQQQQQQQQQSGATASTTRRQTSSQVLRLLAAYAACARGGAAGSVHDAVAMVQHTLHPLPLAHTCQQQPQHDVDDDAAARPLLLARDCDVALEDTRVVPHTDKMLLTTLCVHAHV